MALCHSQVQILTLQKPHIPASFNMYLVISKCVIAVKVSNFSDHYLRDRSTLDIGVLGYIGIVQHKEHSPEVVTLTRGTPCIISTTCRIIKHSSLSHPLYMKKYNNQNLCCVHYIVHKFQDGSTINELTLRLPD